MTLRPWEAADAYTRVAAGVDSNILSCTSVEADASLHEAGQWIADGAENFGAGKSAHFAVIQPGSRAACGSMGLSILTGPTRAEIVIGSFRRIASKDLNSRSWLVGQLGICTAVFRQVGTFGESRQCDVSTASAQRRFPERRKMGSYLSGRQGREDVYILAASRRIG